MCASVCECCSGFDRSRRQQGGITYLRAILASSLLTVCLTAQQQSGWVDPSPHKQRLVQVDPNASVEVLDWGGSGRAIVLLAQMGQTAHIYDDWTPKLAGAYHVLGITSTW